VRDVARRLLAADGREFVLQPWQVAWLVATSEGREGVVPLGCGVGKGWLQARLDEPLGTRSQCPWRRGPPILGHRYRFRVQYNQTGTGRWNYSIQDLATGVTKSTTIASTWHNANGAWWGGETHDPGSTMGPTHTATNDVHMYWMQYLGTSIGSWQVVTDIDSGTDLLRIGAEPSWYHNPIYTENYTDDAINLWTEEH
jgi:hypothetical protein